MMLNFSAKQVVRLFNTVNRSWLKDIVIACILDEFSYNAFKYECNLIYLNPYNYKSLLPANKISLLLVESIWEGIDKTWREPLYDNESRIAVIRRIVKYCKERGIPTVFWNKEDPLHFDKYLEIASVFDYVFTTDENSIKTYTKILKHNRVYALPFSAQPAIHNPIDRNSERLGQIAFAGSWYTNHHHERKHDMDIILKPASEYDLSIYDRNLQKNSVNMRYPDIYSPFIKGSLPYDKIVEIYKKYDIFLNVNSVQTSPTMFARRIFELLACGTNVVSGYAVGIEKLFPGIVLLSKSPEETQFHIETLLQDRTVGDRLSLLGQRAVFHYHTSRHRLKTILDKTGVRYKSEDGRGVSVIGTAEGLEDIEHIWINYSRQSHQKKELIIVLKNCSKEIIKYPSGMRAKFIPLDNASLEECLEKAAAAAAYEHITYFNPRGYYAAEFLGDLLNSFLYVQAPIVGKVTYYCYANKDCKLYLMNQEKEYRYSKEINANAFIMNKSVLGKGFIHFRMDQQTKSNIIEGDAIKMYSSDRFNFVLNTESLSLMDGDYGVWSLNSSQDYLSFATI